MGEPTPLASPEVPIQHSLPFPPKERLNNARDLKTLRAISYLPFLGVGPVFPFPTSSLREPGRLRIGFGEMDKRHPLSVVRSNTVRDHMVPGSSFSDWVKTPHTAAKVLNQD